MKLNLKLMYFYSEIMQPTKCLIVVYFMVTLVMFYFSALASVSASCVLIALLSFQWQF
jgi:hypothetical protein